VNQTKRRSENVVVFVFVVVVEMKERIKRKKQSRYLGK